MDILLLFVIGWIHVILIPYTKVEESFNLHAVHDLLLHGRALDNYDHFIFPGVVPRSFIGSIILSMITGFVALVARPLYVLQSKLELQVLARLVLAGINAFGLVQLGKSVRARYGSKAALMFTLLSCTQFHLPFWMGRTLPNMFALYPVNIASSLILAPAATTLQADQKRFNTAVALLTFATVVLRAEVLLLLGPVVLQGLYLRRTSFPAVIKTGLAAGLVSLVLTVAVDSYFWKQWPLWPELAGQYFNVYQGKSAEWGVSPFYTYFTAFLPKLLLSSLPLCALGLTIDPTTRTIIFPYVAFITLLSLHGHKEWRFIVYAVPVFNAVAARGASWLLSARIKITKSTMMPNFIPRLLLLGLFIVNISATILLTQASMANYPGGEALHLFNNLVVRSNNSVTEVTVHLDNLSLQTGASLFLHEFAAPRLSDDNHGWRVRYDKTEGLEDFGGIEWVITERLDEFGKGNGEAERRREGKWRVLRSVRGLDGIRLLPWRKIRLPGVVKKEKLWILKRDI